MASEEAKPLFNRKHTSTYTRLSRKEGTPTSSLQYFDYTAMTERGQKITEILDDNVGKVTYPWKFIVKKLHAREFLAEFVGTFLLVTIGNGAIAQSVLSGNINNVDPHGNKFGSFLNINFGYGLGLMIALYASIGVSGGHLNPAVTLAMALRCRLSWLKVVPYWIAQYLGAFLSAAVTYGVYVDAILSADCGGADPKAFINCTAGIFATYPMKYLSLSNAFLDQVFGTFLLLLGIFAICDQYNSEPKAGMKPLLIGLLLTVIGMSFGLNAGYAINPARDLSPRIFTAMAGWGVQVFTCPPDQCSIQQWWWVPVVAPMIGGVIAAFFYWFFIEAHHPVASSIKTEETSPLIQEKEEEAGIHTPEPRQSPINDY